MSDDKKRRGGGKSGGHGGARSGRNPRSKEEKSDQALEKKRPVILAKPDREREKANPEFPSLNQTTSGDKGAAAVTLKREDHGPSTVKEGRATDSPKPGDVKPVQSSNVALDKAVKLIDETQQISDSILSFLTDNTDFLVVGVAGPQSSGKSTLMNHLAREGGGPKRSVFREQSFEKQVLGEHASNGITVWINSNQRVILLDCQPLCSASILDRSIQLEKRYPSEFNYAENTIEIHSLQYLGFLMNVCHVMMFVQESFDVSHLKLLLTAEMLKPSSPCLKQGEVALVEEHFPHLIFVQNKARTSDFSSESFRQMQEFYHGALKKSQLKVNGGFTLPKAGVLPNLRDQDESSLTFVNLFLLPDLELIVKNPASSLNFEDLAQALYDTIVGAPRWPLTTSDKLTEKQWFAFAQKSWEIVKSSTFYVEYNRLL